jgi:hypothetical protein
MAAEGTRVRRSNPIMMHQVILSSFVHSLKQWRLYQPFPKPPQPLWQEEASSPAASPTCRARARGIFNPFTLNGLIVVDGVVASAHSDWFLEPFVPAKYEHLIPGLYQQIMGPVRCLYWLVGPAKSRSMAEEWGLVELISGRDVGPFVKWVYGKVAAGRTMLVVAAAAVAARFVKK